MINTSDVLALDVGEKRIGVARSSIIARLPEALDIIEVDGQEIQKIDELIEKHQVQIIVVGLPRNMQGQETQQSQQVRDFAKKLEGLGVMIEFQDESLTSVKAQELNQGKSEKSLDSEAAMLILDDYLARIS